MFFRQRKLDDINDKFKFNAWDDVELPEDHVANAKKKLGLDNLHVSQTNHTNQEEHWDEFYKKNKNNFFKDRKWILHEFPFLNSTNKIILELGCGVGNSLKYISTDNLLIGLDFAETAVKLLRDEGVLCDITYNIPLFNVDYVLSIFCMSAIEPKYHKKIFENLYKVMKKGGKICFRDYGMMDLVQLRYKNEQCVGENLYRRSDGTLTYFFEVDKLREMVESAGFMIENLIEDKRMLTNRKRKMHMYRIMIQGIFVKV